MAVDWLRIKTEYINGNISYRKLAEKYGVSFNTLQDRAKRENWKEERDSQHDKKPKTKFLTLSLMKRRRRR